jgi:hypothetical protein
MTAIVTADYLILGSPITARISTVTDDPITAVIDAYDAGARFIQVVPEDQA